MQKGDKTPHVVIVHGYTASPQQNWFLWLKRELEKEGVRVDVPAMPDSTAPKRDTWVDTLAREVPQVDENTHFIGHSLGCIAALWTLHKQHPGQKVGSLVMVSGFGETVHTLPELAGFTEPRLPLAFARGIAPHRLVITAQDDGIVPCEYSESMAREMQAELVCLPTGGHFLDREGYTEFPFLLKKMRAMIN